MNSFIVSATIVEAPQSRIAGEDQTVAEAWVEVMPMTEGEKPARFRVFAWNGLSDRLMERTVGDRVLLQGSLGMRTVERVEGYKEKLAELSISSIQLMPIVVSEPTKEAEAQTAVSEDVPMVEVVEQADVAGNQSEAARPKSSKRKKAA